MAVRVLKKDSPCVQCNATIRKLESLNIPFEVVIMTDKEIEHYKSLGFMSLPIVETDDQIWSGYRPDQIKILKESESLKNESNHRS